MQVLCRIKSSKWLARREGLPPVYKLDPLAEHLWRSVCVPQKDNSRAKNFYFDSCKFKHSELELLQRLMLPDFALLSTSGRRCFPGLLLDFVMVLVTDFSDIYVD